MSPRRLTSPPRRCANCAHYEAHTHLVGHCLALLPLGREGAGGGVATTALSTCRMWTAVRESDNGNDAAAGAAQVAQHEQSSDAAMARRSRGIRPMRTASDMKPKPITEQQMREARERNLLRRRAERVEAVTKIKLTKP